MTRTKKGCMKPQQPHEMYWQSAAWNQQLFYALRDQVLTLAMSRFRWLNLPETCDQRFLEYTLLTQTVATISYPKKQPGVFYSTQVAYQSPPNIYDNPTRWESIGNNGWRFKANPHQGVIVWDNPTRYPLMQKINMYVQELVDILGAKKTNRVNAKTPFILTGPQEKEMDMINLFKQIAGNEVAVIATDGLETIKVEALQTGVQYLADEFNSDWMNTWNMIYTLLGISNLPFKTERQIEDEVKSMVEPCGLYAKAALDCRRAAANELNRRFAKYLDAPIEVVWNQDVESVNWNVAHDLEQLATLDLIGGESNGELAPVE